MIKLLFGLLVVTFANAGPLGTTLLLKIRNTPHMMAILQKPVCQNLSTQKLEDQDRLGKLLSQAKTNILVYDAEKNAYYLILLLIHIGKTMALLTANISRCANKLICKDT